MLRADASFIKGQHASDHTRDELPEPAYKTSIEIALAPTTLSKSATSIDQRDRVCWSIEDRAVLLHTQEKYSTMSSYQLAAVVRNYADIADDNRLCSGNLNGKIDNRLKVVAEHLRLTAAAVVHRSRRLEHGSVTFDHTLEEAEMTKIEAANLRTKLDGARAQMEELKQDNAR